MKNIRSRKKHISLVSIYAYIMTVLFVCVLLQNKTFASQIEEQEVRIIAYEAQVEGLRDDRYELAVAANEFKNIAETLDNENVELKEANDSKDIELAALRERVELYERYEFAFTDDGGNKTDITPDHIVRLEELVENSKIKSPEFILAVIMTESSGNEHAKSSRSTAKGFGQFLNGTSKFVYTELMGRSNWSPEIAYDGYTNMEMMVNYFDYLYNQANGDLYRMIRYYRGKKDSAYIAKINSYLRTKGLSIDKIAETL